MDFSGTPMAQDHTDTPNALSYGSFASSDKWTDHVKWQGSQTACPALNQLIKLSVNEAVQEGPRISGWQRASSYDQLSSLHSTGHHDTASNSSLLSSHSRPSSKPSSSSRPHSRARLSEARTPASDPTILGLPNPLFNKTNPMQFLDIMKGVSARLDENAGVRPRKEHNLGSGSSCIRAKKRIRGVSLGPEFQAGKATRGIVKKGRVDELRWDESKREIKSTSEDEGLLHSEMRGRSLQAHSSLPDMPSRLDLNRSISSKDVSFMDVDERDDMNLEHASRSAVSSSSNHNYPDARSFARTHSQTEMPPPPFVSDSFVHKQLQSAAADSPLNAHSISTPLAVSRHSNKPQTSYPPPQQSLPTSHSIKQRKSDAIPKLHPLLYQKPSTPRVSSSSIATAPPVQTQHRHVPIPVPDLQPPQPSLTSTPMPSSTPSSRPPPLGMRRNHTFPSRTPSSSTIQQESSPSLAGGQLPQRQKGFKSPLLSLSQPQVQTRMHSHSQLRPNANVIVIESGSTTATSRKVSSLNSPEASWSDNHGFNTTSGNSMAFGSSSSSSFSDSSTSFRSTPPIKSSVSSCSHSNPPSYSKSQESNRGVMHHVQQQLQESVVIPEPLDGDADSSFGDMSFDMDALEETMKMYD